MMTVYMLVTADEMELPVFVSDSIGDMSAELDIPKQTLRDSLRRKTRIDRKYRVIEVGIDEEPFTAVSVSKLGKITKKAQIKKVIDYIENMARSGKQVSIRQACLKHDVSTKTYRKWVRTLNGA